MQVLTLVKRLGGLLMFASSTLQHHAGSIRDFRLLIGPSWVLFQLPNSKLVSNVVEA